MPRNATVVRQTHETKIHIDLDVDGTGQADLQTGIGFFDHMLHLLARHAAFDLKVRADGDLHVDGHHTVEDVGIALGQALVQALGDKAGLRRYGHCTLPMDETLVTVAIDLGGRPFFNWRANIPPMMLGTFASELAEEFWRSVAMNGSMNLHIIELEGRNTHHKIEAIFKSAARALRQACEIDFRTSGIPSTKGTLRS